MRITIALSSAIVLLTSCIASAETPKLPQGAKQLKGDEISNYLDGKNLSFTAYDSDDPMTGTTSWNWKQRKVSGTYIYKGKPGKFSFDWTVKGEENCGEKHGNKQICHKIYVTHDEVYEINEKGAIHAISKVAP